MKVFEVAFVGAGASSLMAASFLQKHSVVLIDASPKIAPKIKISGGGRCNFTNTKISSKNYLGNTQFIDEVFNNFGKKELLEFFDTHNLIYEKRDDGKYFCKKSSSDVIDIFAKLTKKSTFFLSETVQSVEFDKYFIIKTNKQIIRAKKLVVSSGGLSYRSLGASDIGYKIAQNFGHNVITPAPALVGFTLQKEQFWMKSLSGVSLRVALHVENRNFIDDMLFAHKGVSGPAILSASLYWKKGLISVNFAPHIDISKLLHQKNKKQISSVLSLPKRFTKEYLKSISLDDIAVDRLNESQIQKLQKLNFYKFAPAGNFGYTKAEVTKGGVSSDEIKYLTFESIIKKDLYFIGEVLDVTGELGGYNFQWAFSSAAMMAKNMEQ